MVSDHEATVAIECPPHPEATPPEAGAPPRRRLTRGARVALLALGGLILATLLISVVGARPTIRLFAETEEVRVHFVDGGEPTSLLNLNRALLIVHDSVIPLTDVDVEFENEVTIGIKRQHPDTVKIHLETKRGLIGRLYDHGGNEMRTLDTAVDIRVLLAEGSLQSAFLFPFRARKIEVGNLVGFASDQRLPLLRTGEVIIRDRTLLRGETRPRSRTLRLGEQVNVPSDERPVTGVGGGFVRVEGPAGMVVSYSIDRSDAQISADRYTEIVSTGFLDRLTNDPVVGWFWLLVLLLIVQPIGSLIADRMKEVFKPHL